VYDCIIYIYIYIIILAFQHNGDVSLENEEVCHCCNKVFTFTGWRFSQFASSVSMLQDVTASCVPGSSSWWRTEHFV